jgi:hypothetical protein
MCGTRIDSIPTSLVGDGRLLDVQRRIIQGLNPLRGGSATHRRNASCP